MRMMAFYGKGGIGKSTVASNIAVHFARQGMRVLLFGCDPKSDSCYSIISGPITTVMDEWEGRGESELRLEPCLMQGAHGVACLEVGGPPPGIGCGGRGITKTFELLGQPKDLEKRYDVVLFDVLGDVVCGGFAAPMRAGYAKEIYIVSSGEFRAMYAANNIAQAVARFASNGVRMGGLIANLRDNESERASLELLASHLGTQVLQFIPKDPSVMQAEIARSPIVDFKPDSPAALAYTALFERLANLTESEFAVPRLVPRAKFDQLFLTKQGAPHA